MTSSLFDSFNSSNVPSNPTVPPFAPPGFSAPGTVANPASKTPPMTSAQIAAMQKKLQDNNLQQVVQAVTGAYVPGNGSSYDQLEVWAQSLDNGAQNIENLVSSILGIPATAWDGVNEMLSQVESWARQLDGGIQQVLTWWNSLINGLLGSSGGGTGTVYDLTTWLQNAESNATAAWTELQDFFATGNWSDLSSAWQDIVQAIFGTAASAPLTSWIPAAWVAKLPQNSHAVANFPNSSSIVAGGGWSWDSTVSYSGSAGSALYACSGNIGALRGIVVPVQPNQVVTMSASVEWSGVTAASGTSPFQLQIIPWTATIEAGQNVPGTPGTPQNLASITSPASSASWTTLSGTYTVPATGVGFVQVRLLVTEDATTGSVWWNNCITTVTGGYLDTLENDLNTLQSDSAASRAAFGTLLTSVESAITGYTNWSTFISAVESAWNTYTTTESNLLSDEIFTIQNFFSTLLGLNTSTGLISSSNVGGSTGLTTLEDDWNQWVSNIETTWDKLFGITTPPASGTQVQAAAIQSSTGVGSLEADWNQWVSNIQAGWNALWGVTTTPTTSSQVLPAKIAALPASGGASLGANLQATVDNTAGQLLGVPAVSGQSTTQAAAALANTYNTLTSVANNVQMLRTQLSNIGASGGGASYAIQFNTYPDGAFPSVFTLTYSGSGTGYIEVRNSVGHWVPVNDGDRSVFAYYNAGVTYSDYQAFRGAITSIPGAGAKNAAVLRCNNTQTTYVYGEVYPDANYHLTYEVGCVVSGTKTVWDTGSAPIAFDFEFYAGVQGNPNRYQGFAGGQLVFDVTDTAGVFTSSIGSANRGWGFISSTASGGSAVPADASYAVCEDNDPALAVGSGFIAYDNSTSSISMAYTAGSHAFPSGTFNAISKQTADIAGNGDQITIGYAGWYEVTLQAYMPYFDASLGMVTVVGTIIQNGALAKLIPGNGVCFNVVGAKDWTPWFGGTASVYCNAGDTIAPGYYIGGLGTSDGLQIAGDGAGIQTYWEVRLTNRSLT